MATAELERESDEVRLNVRLPEALRDGFGLAAQAQGLPASALLRHLMLAEVMRVQRLLAGSSGGRSS